MAWQQTGSGDISIMNNQNTTLVNIIEDPFFVIQVRGTVSVDVDRQNAQLGQLLSPQIGNQDRFQPRPLDGRYLVSMTLTGRSEEIADACAETRASGGQGNIPHIQRAASFK